MKSDFKNQLTTALLSCPIVYIPHFHYQFIDSTLQEILSPQAGIHSFLDLTMDDIVEFDCARSKVINFSNKKEHTNMRSYDSLEQILCNIVVNKGFSRPVLLLKNFSAQLAKTELQSLMATFASQYEKGVLDRQATIIIASPLPVTSLPRELEKYITVIDIKAPDEKEIMELLKAYPVSARNSIDEKDLRMDLCRTLQGLQYYEIKQILYSSQLRTGGRISYQTKRLALEEKKNIVRKSGIIEVVDADISFDDIGGLEVLKADLERKAFVYQNLSEAQKYKVPLPKGVLIIGMPGCGKTMIAKSIANRFGVSLLRLDINRLMGKYVGESETNLRLALATAEAAHPCVLWIDEIEKAFAGTNGQNSDMLVMRLMGHFLTWMQERTTPVFIVATANDVMRPEFMRKGRFDEVYFVDFPDAREREQILRKTLEPFLKSEDSIFDFSQVMANIADIVGKDDKDKTKGMKGEYGGFSGAEIKSVVNMVIEKKFLEYREMKSKTPDTHNVTVTKADFDEAVEVIRDSVMANQQSKEDPKTKVREKTNIERIREMQEKYKFKRASNVKKTDKK